MIEPMIAFMFLLGYYGTLVLMRRFTIDDESVKIYKMAVGRNRDDILESVRRIKISEATELARKEDSEEDVNEVISSMTKTYIDEEYAQKQIDEYIDTAKKEMFKIRLINFINIILRELFQLVPVFVLILTGDLFWSLILSLAIMTLTALSIEKSAYEVFAYYLKEEEIDDFPLQYKIKIAFFAFLYQVPLYGILLINTIIK